MFSLGVSVCTHTRQVEHQRCSRTGRVQKIQQNLRKNTIFHEHTVHKYMKALKSLLIVIIRSLTFVYCQMILFYFRLLGGENATECSGLWFLTWALASFSAPGIIGPLFDVLKDYRLAKTIRKLHVEN